MLKLRIVVADSSRMEVYSRGIGDVDSVDHENVDLYFNQFKERRKKEDTCLSGEEN